MPYKRILSLNGGGMAGYRTARFLQYIEEETKISCWRLFDMIAGVSAGSIVGAMLSHGIKAADVAQEFKNNGKKIFGSPRCLLCRTFWKSKYDIKNLVNLAQVKLDVDFSDALVPCMIYALHLDGQYLMPRHWKSWQCKGLFLKSSDIVIASSAAPSYFDPYTFLDAEESNGTVISEKRSFTDGSLISNNPTMAAIVEMHKMGVSLNDLYVLNVSYGYECGINPRDFKSLVDLAENLPMSIFSASERANEYEAHHLIGFRNHVVRPSDPVSVSCLNYDLMDAQAKLMWEQHKGEIINKLSEI